MVILMIIILSSLCGCTTENAYREEREKGQVLIDLVEKYQVETGQLPNVYQSRTKKWRLFP